MICQELKVIARIRALRLVMMPTKIAHPTNTASRSFTSSTGGGVTYSNAPASPTLDLVDNRLSPVNFSADSARVYENFISEEEGGALVRDVLFRMKRKRFEGGHWDAVITQYKEVEMPIPSDVDAYVNSGTSPSRAHTPSEESCAVIARTRRHISEIHFNHHGDIGGDREGGVVDLDWLPCHAIHLRKDGNLTAHVDSVKFSGGIVAGISLLSPSIMRLKPASPGELAQANSDNNNNYDSGDKSNLDECNHICTAKNSATTSHSRDGKSIENAGYVDLYLPPLSLYILSGVSRYRYTHELLPKGSKFGPNQIFVDRDDRISIIFRDAKKET